MTARTSTYGVLLVGGMRTHQELYAPWFRADPRCRLIAVADEAGVEPERHALNAELSQQLGVPVVADLDEALSDPAVSIASVCVAPERRARVIARCANAGKHLYLDKPLVPKRDDAQALVRAVKTAGVQSHMFTFITQPWAREARDAIRSGRLGALQAIHAETLFAKGPGGTAQLGSPRCESFPPERQEQPRAKREFDNCGVYAIALAAWLGNSRIRTVFGHTANYFFREHQELDVEDFGVLVGTLENGVAVSITAGRTGWGSHPAGGRNGVLLVGTKDSQRFEAHWPRLEIASADLAWSPPPVHPDDPMGFWVSTQTAVGFQPQRAWQALARPAASDVAYFLDCLDAGRKSEMSIESAAHATQVLWAGYQSAATGQVVTLPGEERW